MSEFDSREKGFEKKFELDEELKFKIAARAAKLFGQWAAAELGMSGADIETYARQMVVADLAEPGIEDLMRKVEADFTAKSVTHSRQILQARYQECLQVADKQLKSA